MQTEVHIKTRNYYQKGTKKLIKSFKRAQVNIKILYITYIYYTFVHEVQ